MILLTVIAGVWGAPVSNAPPPNGSPQNGPPPPGPDNAPGPVNGPGPANQPGPGPANGPAPAPARHGGGPAPAGGAASGYPGYPNGNYYSDQENQVYDQMGNLMATDTSVVGSGSISQGSNGNDGNNEYDNAVTRVGDGETDVNAVAGNQDASLRLDSQKNNIKQFGNENNDANKVKNDVEITSGDSVLNFNVANMDAKTTNTNGNTTVAQAKNLNNESDIYVNN